MPSLHPPRSSQLPGLVQASPNPPPPVSTWCHLVRTRSHQIRAPTSPHPGLPSVCVLDLCPGGTWCSVPSGQSVLSQEAEARQPWGYPPAMTGLLCTETPPPPIAFGPGVLGRPHGSSLDCVLHIQGGQHAHWPLCMRPHQLNKHGQGLLLPISANPLDKTESRNFPNFKAVLAWPSGSVS